MATGTVTGVSATQFTDVKYLPTIVLETGETVAFQGHHIIPTSALVDNELMKALAGANLWDNNNFALNGIALPSSNADLLGLTQHSGGHTGYNGNIEWNEV